MQIHDLFVGFHHKLFLPQFVIQKQRGVELSPLRPANCGFDVGQLGGNAAPGWSAHLLDRFVGEGIDWVHFDTFAWTPAPKPGRSRGGRGLGLRASWHAIRARYA